MGKVDLPERWTGDVNADYLARYPVPQNPGRQAALPRGKLASPVEPILTQEENHERKDGLMSVIRQNLDSCIGCETCVNVCPMDVFRMDADHMKSVIAYVQAAEPAAMWLNCPTDSIGLQDAEVSFGINYGR